MLKFKELEVKKQKLALIGLDKFEDFVDIDMKQILNDFIRNARHIEINDEFSQYALDRIESVTRKFMDIMEEASLLGQELEYLEEIHDGL